MGIAAKSSHSGLKHIKGLRRFRKTRSIAAAMILGAIGVTP
jgi:hypothetical protein